jgi:hypothetical protein
MALSLRQCVTLCIFVNFNGHISQHGTASNVLWILNAVYRNNLSVTER